MATFTVTSGRFDGQQGLSLAEAIGQAMNTPEADVIRFSANMAGAEARGPVQHIEMPGDIEISAGGGALVIDGDIDGDGLTDVLVDADDGRHFTVQSGATLTLRNLDLITAADRGDAGEDGARGAPHTAVLDPVTGLDGRNGVDAEFLPDVQRGASGADGEAGEIAAASILNEGRTTLIRVGFGDNTALGGVGGEGGSGREGRAGRSGSDGFGDPGATGGYADPVFSSVGLGFDFDEDGPNALPAALANPAGKQILPGGRGGAGARGGDGGDGGRGGDGGDAGIVVNGDGATLQMIDVVFGGVLSSGIIGEGNRATGGDGHRGGQAGSGGNGGPGGDGGDFDFMWLSSGQVISFVDDKNWQAAWVRDYFSTAGGEGGRGGDGGSPGRAGDSGDGGDAGTVLNLGRLEGKAAITTNPLGENGRGTAFNSAEGGEGDRFSLPFTGFAGFGGSSQGGRQVSENWEAWGVTATKAPGFRVFGSTLPGDMETSPRFPASAWQAFNGVLGTPENTFSNRERNLPFRERAAANPGEDGEKTAPDPSNGMLGGDSDGVFGPGSSEASIAGSLVYVHDMGVRDGALTFNIIRVGDAAQQASVDWRVTGPGSAGVSSSDFIPGSPLLGSVTFGEVSFAGSELDQSVSARGASSRIVSIALAQDGVAEGAEDYRIQLSNLSGAGGLGTARVEGQVTDADETGASGGGQGPGPKATNGRDRFVGDNGKDRFDAKGGNDVLLGKGGRDRLDGGAGKDRIDAGAGNDVLEGGRGNDRLKGGSGKDDFHFRRGDGRDVIEDFRVNQDDIVLKGVKRFAQLDIDQKGKNVVIDHGKASDQIKLLKVDADDLDARDFIFA